MGAYSVNRSVCQLHITTAAKLTRRRPWRRHCSDDSVHDLEPAAAGHISNVDCRVDTNTRAIEGETPLQRQHALSCLQVAAGEFECLWIKADAELGTTAGFGKPDHDVPEFDALPQPPRWIVAQADNLHAMISMAEGLND